MKSLRFAARALWRQPGRALLGIAGISGVGALLFDMLLLSNGLVVSLRHVLDEVGYDVRVSATDAIVGTGPRLTNARAALGTIRALAGVADAVVVRLAGAEVVTKDAAVPFGLIGSDPPDASGAAARGAPWTIVEGRDLSRDAAAAVPSLVVNARAIELLHASVGETILVRGACSAERSAMPPRPFRIAGVARFPFDDATNVTAAARFADVSRLCGEEARDEADVILVASRTGVEPQATVAAIHAAAPGLHAYTNDQLIGRIQEAGLSYFRQISTALTTVTLFFGFLLITVLLTVSVNQRLGEIATLRALGFSRRRGGADGLGQSTLRVGSGGALALPLGVALSAWLDTILRAMPGIPGTLHFFEYEPRALVLHVTLLALTAVLAAAYPVKLVASLPIATTLRNEVVS
jgi:putative ABC transport system permease protein